MAQIVQKDSPSLREPTKPVPLADITSPKIQKILKAMSSALAKEPDGVALAAPQIGLPLKIFVVSGRMLAKDLDQPKPWPADLVFINPEIAKRSKRQVKMEEGCLSVRWWYGEVKRSDKVTITAYDQTGRKFTRHGSGLWAQIFQHEIDHLNGVLFTDKADNLREIDPSLLA